MDLLIQRQQFVISQLRATERIVDVKNLFDEVIAFLNNSVNDRMDSLHVLTVICNELAGFMVVQSFNHPDIINHQFFLIVSNTFMMLLTKLTFLPLTKEEEQCIDGISLLISTLCLYKNKIVTCFYTDNNEQLNPDNKTKLNLLSYEKIFFNDLFIKKFIRILKNDIAINEYESYDIKYKVFNRLLYLFSKLNYTDHELILDSVLQCIESEIYINLYKTIQFSQPILTPKQLFFMYQCPKFICQCRHKQQDEIIRVLCKSIVGYGSVIFEKHLPIVFNEDNENNKEDEGAKVRAVAWYIKLLNHFALIPATRVCFIEKRNLDTSMIDQMIMILRTPSLIKSVCKHQEFFHADVMLISYSIILLYNLTFEKKIFNELKDKIVIKICEKLYQAKDRTIQFAAQTLCAILKKEDIDQIESPTDVVRSYLYMIEHTIDDLTLTYHGIRLDGVITNLEEIVQNDEVKEEITNDEEGIPLIARCAYENLDEETIRRPAVRIIDAISFANDLAVEQIKENDLLMNYIKNLADDSKNKSPIPEVNRLLWKVEEKEFILKQDNQRKRTSVQTKKIFDEKKAIYQYIRGDHRFCLDDQESLEKFDIMISYCQNDKEFAEKIYNRLIASNTYRVAFDKENKHSSDPKIMAKAVEQSDIIIICFSTKYRNSYACRLEAEYANKRKSVIIPVKIERIYDPTGWLKKITDKTNYIDFTNSEFNTAYGKLIDRINEEYD